MHMKYTTAQQYNTTKISIQRHPQNPKVHAHDYRVKSILHTQFVPEHNKYRDLETAFFGMLVEHPFNHCT